MRTMINRNWLVAAMAVAFAVPSWAVYNPFPLRDSTRPWALSLNTSVGYDDNINTTHANRDDSLTYGISPQALVNWVLEETFVGLRYTYSATYYEKRANWDQSHSADFLFSHTFNPQLVLDMSDQFRRGVEPDLVELIAGVPVTIRRVGDYYYNNLSDTLTYNLSRRWTVSAAGSWQLWRYDDDTVAVTSDYDVYQEVGTLLYSVSPQTFVGANYRYAATRYKSPGINDARNSDGHAVYATLIQRFSPQLTALVNAGYEVREFEDGASSDSPYVVGSVSYSYAPGSAASLSVSYAFTDTGPGYSTYRSSEAVVTALQVSHQITPKLRLSVSTSYSYGTYSDPLVVTVNQALNPETLSASAVLRYTFTSWLSSDLSYSYDLQFGDSAVTSFYRDRVSLGLRFVY